MSLINDALKEARRTPPQSLPTALPPFQPVAQEPSSPMLAWLLPAVVILLVGTAIFFIGRAWSKDRIGMVVAAAEPAVAERVPAPAVAPAAAVVATVPEVKPTPPPQPQPVETPAPPPASPPEPLPKLQGIFFSPTAPSAILDGKIIRPGDQYRQYRVKAISKYTVTLVGPDKKDTQVGMGN